MRQSCAANEVKSSWKLPVKARTAPTMTVDSNMRFPFLHGKYENDGASGAR